MKFSIKNHRLMLRLITLCKVFFLYDNEKLFGMKWKYGKRKVFFYLFYIFSLLALAFLVDVIKKFAVIRVTERGLTH